MKKQILTIITAILVAGCSSLTITGSALPTGEKRAPTSPQQVTLYQAVPEKAVILGTVQVVASVSMKENMKVIELVLPELQNQAAAIGANGIVTKTKVIDRVTGAETHTADAIYVPK